MAKARRSSSKVPITNNEKVKTAESSGEENEEKNSASAVTITNWRMMKYKATSIHGLGLCKAFETYQEAANTPIAMKNVFTTSVPESPKNLPAINSHRCTGRDSTV